MSLPIIEIATNIDKYGLTGLSNGQIIHVADSNTFQRYVGPFLLVDHTIRDGRYYPAAYQIGGRTAFCTRRSGARITRQDDRWDLAGSYYSTSDVLFPNLATDWKRSDNGSPATQLSIAAVNESDSASWSTSNDLMLLGLQSALAALTVRLDAASQILLAAPYVPTPVPVLTIPQPAEDDSLCLVYLYAETLANAKRAGLLVSFKLDGPARSERMLDNSQVTMTTNSDRYAEIVLQRTDKLLPASRKCLVTCPELGLKKAATMLSAPTFDLATLIG